jgi:hypothetical protein
MRVSVLNTCQDLMALSVGVMETRLLDDVSVHDYLSRASLFVLPVLAIFIGWYAHFTPESHLPGLKPILIFGLYALWTWMILRQVWRTWRRAWQALIFGVSSAVVVAFCGFSTLIVGGYYDDCENIGVVESHVRYRCYVGDGEYGYFEAELGSIFMSFAGMETY